MIFSFKQRPGAAAIITVLGVTMVVLAAFLTLSTLMTDQLTQVSDTEASDSAFFAAEGGIQQALYSLGQNSVFVGNYPTMTIGDVNVNVTVSDMAGGKKHIVSTATSSGQTVRTLAINAYPTSFGGFRGAVQTGTGGAGLIVRNGATITGNVYANGPIDGKKATFNGDVKLSQMFDYTVTNGTINGALVEHQYLPDEPYPIPYDFYRPDDAVTPQIEGTLYNLAKLGGEQDCTSGCIITNPPTCPLDPNTCIGPKIYRGNVELTGDITLRGTIWITGNLTVNGGTNINLIPSYGINSEVVVAEGKIDMGTNITISGSGDSDNQSFILIVSLSSALGDTSNAAINVWCNAGAAIFFAPFGSLYQKNNLALNNSTAKTVILQENNTVTYDEKLAYINIPGNSNEKVMVPEKNTWQEL